MSAWILAVEGTEVGHQLAMVLALSAAFLHAVFGALQKGQHDPWLSRGAIDICYFMMAMPIAVFVLPWPEPGLWPIFLGMVITHLIYKLMQAAAYSRGAYTVVYPVVRGTGPVFTVLGAYLIFGETFTMLQWVGVAVLVLGLFGLALYNAVYLIEDRATLRAALGFALVTGLFVALYTTYDAYGIRAAQDPFVFLIWFFVLDGLSMPPFAYLRWRKMRNRPDLFPLFLRGMIGAWVAFFSFGSIMLATRLDKVGEAAILRETSTVFAALIGWYFLKEAVGPRRVALILLIAAGAVIVEVAG